MLIWKLKLLGCYLRFGGLIFGWSPEQQKEKFYRLVDKWISRLE
jgi:hypothetical protein